MCAHRLHPRHDISVFEAETRIGGHVNSRVDVDAGARGRHRLHRLQRTHLSGLHALLAELGVETQPSEMSFGVRCDRSGLEWASRGLASVFAAARPTSLRPPFLRMLRDVVRFEREARGLLAAPERRLSLGEFLAGGGYERELAEHYVVPMGAAIWSAAPERFLRLPGVSFARFFENHGLLSLRSEVRWRVVRGGSARYVEKLVAPFRARDPHRHARVRGAAPRRTASMSSRAAACGAFDRVVLAVHSDQALALLDPRPASRAARALGAIRYQANEAVLHTDASLLPRRAARLGELELPHPARAAGARAVTYHMNRLQGLATPAPLFVTLERRRRDRARSACCAASRTTTRCSTRPRSRRSAGTPRSTARAASTSAGAYWGYGFHEDGVRSAHRGVRSARSGG